MRSYDEYCALAKALDVIGDRWNLLIVRELLLRGPARYADLRDGLPGIATNLLADRLRELESSGIVAREEVPPPVARTLFRLTPRGKALEPVLLELVHWGAPYMAESDTDDAYRSHWLLLPIQLYLEDDAADRPPVVIELRQGGEPVTVETVDGRLRTRPGPAEQPDLILTGSPKLVLAVLTGMLDLAEAKARGLQYEGAPEALRRVQPNGPRYRPPVDALRGNDVNS